MLQDFEGHTRSARVELETANQLLSDEIRRYPTPIAGCDEQFNFLLKERAKVRSALQSLDRAIFVPTPRSLFPTAGIENR